MSARIALPDPSGPQNIGVTDFELTDTSREERFAPGTHRRIPVRAWYPTAVGSGATRPNAKPAELQHQVVPYCRLMSSDADFAAALDYPTHAHEDAPPLAHARHPVLIFSHGAFSCPQMNTGLMEHFASHGYVVLSISHPYVDSATLHENGDIVPADTALLEDMWANAAKPVFAAAYSAPEPGDRIAAQLAVCRELRLASQFEVWEQDFIHVVDRLHQADLPPRAASLSGVVDLDRLGVFGVSFGGSGSTAAIRDTRIKAAINLDGGIFSSALLGRDSRIPVLLMNSDMAPFPGSGTRTYPHSEFFYETFATAGTRADVIRVEVKGSTHNAFSDLCLMPAELRANPSHAALTGTIDGRRMATIVNDFCKTFFDHFLSNEGAGFDPAFRAKYPEVLDVDLAHVREWAAANPRAVLMA